MIQSNIILINFLLTLPIISCIYIYCKNYNFKKKILFAEAYFGLNVLCYCAYLLIHYRIHHSYNDLGDNEFLSAIYLFYFLFIVIIFYLYISKKENFFDKFNFRFHESFLLNLKKNNNKIIFSFIFFGFILFFINRMGIFICDNTFLNKISSTPLLAQIAGKIHTISYFGFFMIIAGLMLYINKVDKFKLAKKIQIFLIYIFISFLLIILILNSSTSVSMIIILLIISSLILHTKSKIFFYLNLIILSALILILNSVKNEIRKEISPLVWDCKLELIDNSKFITNKATSFYQLNGDKLYIDDKGNFVKTDVSFLRYFMANFFERVDFLQMLSQTKYMVKNDLLELKKGKTYFNSQNNWQKTFGVDIKQLPISIKDLSSFNMPASVESYYNFGNFGFIVFSIFMGFLIYLISLFLNSKYLSNEHKIIYLIIFFHSLI